MILNLLKDTIVAFIIFLAISFLSIFPYLIPGFSAKDSILEIGFPFKFYWVEYFCDGNIIGVWHHKILLLNAIIIWLIIIIVNSLIRRKQS